MTLRQILLVPSMGMSLQGMIDYIVRGSLTMPSTKHAARATGEDESRELRFTRNEDGSYQCVIWWGRGDRALGFLSFDAAEMEALKEWLNTAAD